MNASAIFGQDEDKLTLEEKLAAIDRAMQAAQEQASEEQASRGMTVTPLDPASLTICDGCE